MRNSNTMCVDGAHIGLAFHDIIRIMRTSIAAGFQLVRHLLQQMQIVRFLTDLKEITAEQGIHIGIHIGYTQGITVIKLQHLPDTYQILIIQQLLDENNGTSKTSSSFLMVKMISGS
mgnify:CR=1 FL=1